MKAIKNMFVVSCKTLGIVTATAKDSFMEGYRNPYKPQEEVVKEPEVTAWNEDSDLDMAR